MDHMVYRIGNCDVVGRHRGGQTRCEHYHQLYDVIAIKFRCCHRYYDCYQCHQELAGHAVTRWLPDDFEQKAVLCGHCGHELTINEYLASGYKCPACYTPFNPHCRNHYHHYFALS